MGRAKAHPKVLRCVMPRTAAVCGLAALAGLAVAAWLWASRHELRFSVFHDSAPVERLWRARYVRRALAGWFLSSMRAETAESAPDGVPCAAEPVGVSVGSDGGPVTVADLRAYYKSRQPPKVCVVSLSVGRKDPSMILTQSVGTGMHFSRLPSDPDSYWAKGAASPPPQICSSRAWDAAPASASATPLAHWIVLDVDSRPHPEAAALSDVVTVVKAGGALSDPLAAAALDRRQAEFWRCSAALAEWQAAAEAIAGNSSFRAGVESQLAALAARGGTGSALWASEPEQRRSHPTGRGIPAGAGPAGGGLRSGGPRGDGPVDDATALLLRWGQLTSLPPLGPGAPLGPLPSPPAACTPFAAFALRRDLNARGTRLSRRSPWRQWPRLHSRHAKATLDYALALDVCSNAVGAELAVVLEDDAVMTRGWLNKLLLSVVPRAAELAADDEAAHPPGTENGPAEARLSLPGADSEPWKFRFHEGPAMAAPLRERPSLAARVAAGTASASASAVSGEEDAAGGAEGAVFTPLEGSEDDDVLRLDPAAAASAAAARRSDAFEADASSALQRRVTWVKLFYPDFLEQWGEGDIPGMVAGPTAFGVAVLLCSCWALGLVECGPAGPCPTGRAARMSSGSGGGGGGGRGGCSEVDSRCWFCGLWCCCCAGCCGGLDGGSGTRHGPRQGERGGASCSSPGSLSAASHRSDASDLAPALRSPSSTQGRVPNSACTLEARCAGQPTPQRWAGSRAPSRRAATVELSKVHTVLRAGCLELRCSCGCCATKQRRGSHADSDSVGSEGSPPQGEAADAEAAFAGASITRRAMPPQSGPEVSPLP